MQSTLVSLRPRRHLLAAAAMTALLAACGGGGSAGPEAPAPQILEFSADRTRHAVGERAQLRVRYAGGNGRIEPGIGAVASGASIDTSVLDASRRYRLIVDAPGKPGASRELAIEVGFRDRYASFEAPQMAHHATVAAADGSAIVLGGSRGEGVLSSAIERFDPATRRLTRIGQMATGRANASAVRLADGRILVFGGTASANELPFAELVDERTGAVTRAGTLRQGRIRHAAVQLADGRVMAIGGSNRDSVEIWSPATRDWRLVAQRMAHDREYASATLLPDGKVLIVGGDTESNAYVFAEVFDPATERFTPVAGAPVERRWLHGAYRGADGSVWLIGGEGGSQGVGLLASVWRFMPSTGRFEPQTPLTAARTLVAGVMTPDDEALLIGGQVSGEFVTGAGVSYRNGSQRGLPMLRSQRAWHTVTRLADGRVLVLGGEDHLGRFAVDGAIYE